MDYHANTGAFARKDDKKVDSRFEANFESKTILRFTKEASLCGGASGVF